MSAHSTTAIDATHLDPARRATVTRVGFISLVVGVLATAAAWVSNPERFAHAYLTAFSWLATLALGALFFVLIQHITRAGWSVGPRRVAEWVGGVLPVTALLFIPVAVTSHTLFHHWMEPDTTDAHYPVLAGKAGYLNEPFFFIRAAVFLLAWAGLAWLFARTSLAQDKSGDPKLTLKMQAWSGPALLVYAITLTFASFDWLMSLDPHWFSTIFGVYVFSGGFVAALGLIALLSMWLQGQGLLSRVSNVEHLHDLGKLLFGFTVFWAYIGFCQFFLIWYANIPEETIFFKTRWEPMWQPWSWALIFGHFWIPFFLLLPRTTKRKGLTLGLGSVLLIVMHYVDMYWLVMPNIEGWQGFSWIDFAAALGPAGVLAWWISRRAARDAIYPLRDPRLAEAVAALNL